MRVAMVAASAAMALAVAACAVSISPTPTPYPTYIPYPTAACWAGPPYFGWLHGDPDKPDEVQLQLASPRDALVTFFSPRHYDLVFDPDLQVVNGEGQTVAREGDLIQTVGMDIGPGTVLNERFEWCGTLTKLDHLPPGVRPTPTPTGN